MADTGSVSALAEYLDGASAQDVITALVRRIRTWRTIEGQGSAEQARRRKIEARLAAILAQDPASRLALALQADHEEPGPLPRLIMENAQNWITPPLAAALLGRLSSIDGRHRPLILACTRMLIDAGVEDADTIILHLYALRDSGDVETAEELARMALETAEEPEDLGRLDALLAEICFTDGRYEEALTFWRNSIGKDEATAMRLNNCGAALQYLGRTGEAALAFRDAARLARGAPPDDPDPYRSRGSACVNMAMGALERGRIGTALNLARIGIEHYRDLLARHPGHSDTDISDLFAPLIVALDEADLIAESNTLAQEALDLAEARYADNPDIGACGLIDVLTMLHQSALETGQFSLARTHSVRFRQIAERHHGQPFGVGDAELALALAAEADALFLDNQTPEALVLYEEVDDLLDRIDPGQHLEEVFVSRLNHAMALNDAGRHGAAADRLYAHLPTLRNKAAGNGWLWALVARGYSDLAIVESSRGRAEETRAAIRASRTAARSVKAGGRNQWINATEQSIAIANSLSNIGDFGDAIALLDRVIAELEARAGTQADDAAALLLFEALNDLGLITYAAGDHDASARAFERAVNLGDGADERSVMAQRVARTLINRAGALSEAHRFDEAKGFLDRVETILHPGSPGWADYLNNQAVVMLGQGEPESALHVFQQARKAADTNEDIWRATLNTAAVLADLERWQGSRDEARHLIDATQPAVFDPEGVDAVTLYFWLAGRIVAARGAAFCGAGADGVDEAESALADFERFAKHLGPDRVQLHGYAFEALGDALAATARQDEARLEWRNALARFQSHKPERWQQEIHRLKQKAEGEG